MDPVECVAEELLIDLDMDIAELEKFRFQSRTQTPDKVGYLEKLEENVATYKKTDEFRKTDGFKRIDELRKTGDFKRTDDNPDKIDDFKRTDDNPDRIDDFKRTDDVKGTDEFKRTDEIYWSGVGFNEMPWIDEISSVSTCYI